MSKAMSLKEAHAVIAAAREEENAKQVEEARALVGRYFKFRNSYGRDEKWWLYAKVVDVEEWGGAVATLSFQKATDNHIDIRQEHHQWIRDDWKEITSGEFWRAASDILEEVTALLTQQAPAKPPRRK